MTAIVVDDFNVQFHHVSRAVKINRSNRLPLDHKRRQLPLSMIIIGRSLAPLKAMKEFISMSEVFLTPVTFTFTLILKLWLTLIRPAYEGHILLAPSLLTPALYSMLSLRNNSVSDLGPAE